MIHRPIRLVDIVTLGRKYKLEPKVIQFVHPRANKAPNLVLVEFTKDGKPELKNIRSIICLWRKWKLYKRNRRNICK